MTFRQKKIEIVYKIIAFTKSDDVYAQDYILKKKNTEKYYNQILLGTIDGDSLLPEHIKDMLAESLIKDNQ